MKRLRVGTACALLLLAACGSEGGQSEAARVADPTDSLFHPLHLTTDPREMASKVFLPVGYDSSRSWPVIVFYHGSGERGTDGWEQTTVGLPRLLRVHPERVGAIVFAPQYSGSNRTIWSPARASRALIDTVIARYHGDADRVTITGTSLGALAATQLALDAPGDFAGLLLFGTDGCPVCQPVMPDSARSGWQGGRLRGLPLWIWHGERDGYVDVARVRDYVAALRTAGAAVRYTEIAGGPHNVWDPAYADSAVIGWLLRQRRSTAARR